MTSLFRKYRVEIALLSAILFAVILAAAFLASPASARISNGLVVVRQFSGLSFHGDW
jgi:hypothetical protein